MIVRFLALFLTLFLSFSVSAEKVTYLVGSDGVRYQVKSAVSLAEGKVKVIEQGEIKEISVGKQNIQILKPEIPLRLIGILLGMLCMLIAAVSSEKTVAFSGLMAIFAGGVTSLIALSSSSTLLTVLAILAAITAFFSSFFSDREYAREKEEKEKNIFYTAVAVYEILMVGTLFVFA